MGTEFVVITGGEDAGILSVNTGGFWSCTWFVARFVGPSRSKQQLVRSGGSGAVGWGSSVFSGGAVVITWEFVVAGMLAGCAAALDTGFSGGAKVAAWVSAVKTKWLRSSSMR